MAPGFLISEILAYPVLRPGKQMVVVLKGYCEQI